MAKTLSTLLTGCGVSLFPALSFGLGLGDIQIESRLNQPLYARIEIVDVSDEEWQQIRARIAPPTLLSETPVHPEILESLTLRAAQDARHGHFIEIKSGEPLTEPLFDLPVEVAGQSLQVVRNYSVLLDPPSSQDAPPSAAVVTTASQGAAAGHAPTLRGSRQPVANDTAGGETAAVRTPAVAGVDHKARVARHEGGGARVARSGAGDTTHVAYATGVANAAKAAEQQQLEGQLTSLQETLTKMQATIAAQDVEIAKLMTQITARSNSQAPARRESTPQVAQAQAAASDSDAADDDATYERPSWFQRWRATIYWVCGVGAGVVLLAISAVLYIRRRNAHALREIARQEAARRNAPREEPRSNPLAWQSTLRAAQTGTWQSPADTASRHVLAASYEMASGSSGSWSTRSDSSSKVDTVASVETPGLPDLEEPPGKSTSPSANADTVVATVAIEELTQDLQADLEALSASYEDEVLQSSSPAVDAWRKQNAMLERDYLSDTEALPFVLDAGNQAKAIETGRNPAPPSKLNVEKTVVDASSDTAVATHRMPAANQPAMAGAGAARTSRNREVAAILEQSLDYEPGRVDIQLKLLEIYHHEALGNRGNFDSLLRKLAADPQQLSPAQQLHVEMLHRTLRDGNHDTDSDFVADVAI
jgi:pilus assembly protein FimV